MTPERSEKASLGRILQGKEPWILSLREQRKYRASKAQYDLSNHVGACDCTVR
jgi:hypothetical protein